MDLIFLFLMYTVIGILATWVFELILQTNKKLRDRYYRRHEVLLGYHVHHSTIGLLAIIVAVLFFVHFPSFSVGLAGFGSGIIIMHTISSRRFVFIERETFSK